MIHPVYIVGAGPGDPELLTLKAYRLLNQWAEVVIHDRLIAKSLLDSIPAHVEKVYAGKAPDIHTMTQDEIHQQLLDYTGQGKKIVRLKGGDPLIFGRGGEEVEFLHAQGIPFELVAGISAASGISAKLGIPLTHRGLATSVRYITGHKKRDEALNLNWKSLADPDTTLVVYMGLANLAEITINLMAAGLSPQTRAAAIQNGTCQDERTIFTTLEKIAEEVKAQALEPPVLIIIGRVVEVGEGLSPLLCHPGS